MMLELELKTDVVELHIPMTFERRGGRKVVIAPDVAAQTDKTPKRDEALVRALVKAHCWRRRIETGDAKSITDLAAQEGVTDAYVCRLLPLTCLAPNLVATILNGRQSSSTKVQSLTRSIPYVWEQQRDV